MKYNYRVMNDLLNKLESRASETSGGSYLFWGQDDMGKFESAVRFAKMLEGGDEQAATAIDKRIHPDVLIIEPEIIEDKEGGVEEKEIGIAEVRNANYFLSRFSQSGFYKIVIVNKADRLTEEAQNSFLKILEEPRGRAVLILITSKLGCLLPTIVSRLFRVRFANWGEEKIRDYLIKNGAEESAARVFARKSQGRPLLAKKMMIDSDFNKITNKGITDFLDDIFEKNAADRFLYIESVFKNTKQCERLLNAGIILFRDMLLIKSGSGDLIMNLDFSDRIGRLAEKYETRKISDILRSISETISVLDNTNVNSRLVLENLMLKI